MSGAEAGFIIGLIGSLISIIEGAKRVYDAAGDAKGQPEAFRQVAARLPLVTEILYSAKERACTLDEMAQEALEPLLESCEAKAKDLKKIFQKVIRKDDDKWIDRYKKALSTLGKGSKVECLMEGILKDTQLLACERLKGTATEAQAKELEQAIKEMKKMPPSLEEDTGSVIQTNYGSGNIMVHKGWGNNYGGISFGNLNSGFQAGNVNGRVSGIDFGYPHGHITLPVSPIEKIKIQAPAVSEADGSGRGPAWTGATFPQGYQDLTNQIQNQGCELLNLNRTLGSVDVLFQKSRPSKLGDGSSDTNVDWVESDEGAQLMLLISLQSTVKLHSLQLTALPPNGDYPPVRPRTIRLYINQLQNLGFDDAEDIPATQVITLEKEDWNSEGTAKVALRFVKFQNVSSLVVFIQDGADDGERTRLDRVRLIGRISKAKLHEYQTDDEETHGDAVAVDLKAEVLRLPQPQRKVLAPFINDDETRKQVEQKYMELKNNATLRKESATSLLDALGRMEDEEESSLGVAIEKSIQETSGSVDLMAESQDYPQPLREVLGPYLHDDAIRQLIEEKYNKLRDDGNLRQVSTANFLNALGSLDEEENGLEDSEDQRHKASGGNQGPAPSKGGSSAGGSGPSGEGSVSGGDRTSGGNDASGGGGGAMGDGAPGEGIAPSGNALPPLQVPRFMDWTLEKGYELPAKDDANQSEYLLAMAVWQNVELGVQVLGNGGTMKGFLAALYQAFHQRDVLALFRTTNRTIFVPAELPNASPHVLDDLEKGLFDTSKFRGYDERLTALTYNDGKGGNGSITLFKLDTWNAGRPNSLHPIAAMDNVFKSVLRKISSGAKDSRRTTLSKPKLKIWEATIQQTNIQHPKLVSRPDLTRSPAGGRGLTIGNVLKTALSIDRNDLVDCFSATVPQMIAILHHKASILRVVRSGEIIADEGQRLRGVTLDNFPPGSGHDGSNPLIIVLCPTDGDWVKEKLSWK